MALTHQPRRFAPCDGTWFQSTAWLGHILRAASRHDDSMHWPKSMEDTRVPVWIKMEQYKAQETRENPSGMMFGPVVRIGTMQSPEIEMFGHHGAAGLFHDYRLNYDDPDGTKWIYRPYSYTSSHYAPGEDASVYQCDQCMELLYRDDMGRRFDRSACIFDGGLVCRDCEVTGLVYDQEVSDRLDLARKLADRVGGDCRSNFENRLNSLGFPSYFGSPSQTRLYKDGKWSFGFSISVFTDEGRKKGLHGGFIQHGPCPTLNEDGTFKFTEWDYKNSCIRDATPDEISGIRWSTHT